MAFCVAPAFRSEPPLVHRRRTVPLASSRRTGYRDSPMTSRKILIVDDDADLLEAIVDQPSLYGEFERRQATSATAGMQAARDGHTDLIIMDVGLPDMDGGE